MFEVSVIGDSLSEPDETFNVLIGNVVGATLADGSATGTLSNDDSAAVTGIAEIQGSGAVSHCSGNPWSATASSPPSSTGASSCRARTALATLAAILPRASSSPVAHNPLARGDFVRVEGLVQEVEAGEAAHQLTQTQIAARSVGVLRQNLPLPQALVLDSGNAGANQAGAGLERFEGMRVAAARLSVVAPAGGSINESTGAVRGNGQFYGVVEGVARPFVEPGMNQLDRAARASAANGRVFDGNPERLLVNSAAQRGAHSMSADTGDRIAGLVGVLAYGNGSYQLLPDADASRPCDPAPARKPFRLRPQASSASV